MNAITVTIPTGASRDTHCVLLNELEHHVIRRPDVLDLRLGGEPAMAPSIAAAYCALIVRFLGGGGDVVTSAVTPLTGPAAILWLHGSVRRINPGTYIVFTSPPSERNIEPEYSHVGGPPEPKTPIIRPEFECYGRLLRRAHRFLNIGDVLDRPLFEEHLRSFLLIGPVAPTKPAWRASPSSNIRTQGQDLWDSEPPASQLQS